MLTKFIFILLVLLVGCQNSSSGEKDKPEKENKEITQQTSIRPEEIDTLIKGSDSILISKKKVVEKWDQEWSVINYEFYNESLNLASYQLAINKYILKSLYHPFEAKTYHEPLSKKLIRKVLKTFLIEARRYEDDLSMTWYLGETYQILDTYKEFATLKRESSLYTGGAHGMFGISLQHFNKSDGAKLDIADFLRIDKKLLVQAEQVFRKTVGIAASIPFEDAGYWFNEGFYLSENFEPTNKGITFYYNPYEVSSWATGMVEFKLSKTQLSPYLKREI